MTEEQFKALLERANELKLRELFEEPSTFEDEDVEEYYFSGRLTQR